MPDGLSLMCNAAFQKTAGKRTWFLVYFVLVLGPKPRRQRAEETRLFFTVVTASGPSWRRRTKTQQTRSLCLFFVYYFNGFRLPYIVLSATSYRRRRYKFRTKRGFGDRARRVFHPPLRDNRSCFPRNLARPATVTTVRFVPVTSSALF